MRPVHARRNLCQTHRTFQKQPRWKIREEPRLRIRPALGSRMGKFRNAARARADRKILLKNFTSYRFPEKVRP